MIEQCWYSVEEIGQYPGVNKGTISAWIANKSMPAHKVGPLCKFKTDEVDEWVRAGGATEEQKADK